MTTETTITETETATHGTTGVLWFRPGGRHRKPRRRSTVLAVGGLALAAGALSLVRLGPDAATGGGGPAQADPPIRATDTASTITTEPSRTGADRHSVVPAPGTTRAATADSAGTSPTSLSARPPGSAPSATDPATGIPEAPSTPRAPAAPGAPSGTRTVSPEPAPTTTTPGSTPTHAPAPDPAPPGLCVPLIGLCLSGG